MTAAADATAPVVRFYRIVPEAPEPMRADRSALGMLPTAAFQYCEPVCSASAFGWYVFPPAAFHVQWDGTDFVWTHDDGDTWQPLVSEHFPGLPERFDADAPEDMRGLAPPFLSRVAQPGVLQIWSGLLARTAPGWSILVRPPANLPRSQHFEVYEGIIETDRWFSAVFANLRMITANRPIEFDPTLPLVQVQPLQRATYDEAALRSFDVVGSIASFTADDWDAYRHSIASRRTDRMLRPGRYATDVRKRARKHDE